MERECVKLLEKLIRLCPSNEGLGGHAPLSAFYQVAWEAKRLLDKQLTPEQQLLKSYINQLSPDRKEKP